ncbi:MAG: hypothetical protein ACRCZF_14800, partial [Gemmataceae bacterium]
MTQYFEGLFKQTLPSASTPDTTVPAFNGISGLAANANGSLAASWATATDPTLPLRYLVFL